MVAFVDPSIAQLVERWTVEVLWLSIGRWFESGSKDYFFILLARIIRHMNNMTVKKDIQR